MTDAMNTLITAVLPFRDNCRQDQVITMYVGYPAQYLGQGLLYLEVRTKPDS